MNAQQRIAKAATENGWHSINKPNDHSSVLRFRRNGEEVHIWFTWKGAVSSYSATNGTGVIVRGGHATRAKFTRVIELIEGI